MVLIGLLDFFVISGIFSRKDADLELLPPPPPFPAMMENEEVLEKKQQKKEAIRIEEKIEKKGKKIKVKSGKPQKAELSELYGSLGVNEAEKKRKNEKLPKTKEEKKTKIGEVDFDEELKEIEDIEIGHEKELKVRTPEIEFTGYRDLEEKKPYESVSSEKEISHAIDSVRKTQRKTSFLKALFRKKEKIQEERVETPDIMPRFDEKVDGLILIEEKMHKARLALMDFRFEQAKRIYMEIIRVYNHLEPWKRAKVYQDITDLYYERKSAEKYAK